MAAIIGGGPSGSGCALALLKIAEEKGIKLNIIIYEGKVFEKSTHFNQCVGVLSPPIVEILKDDLNVDFPYEMNQRKIKGYILHGHSKSISLEDTHSTSIALRRVNFDDFLLKQAVERGARVVRGRITDFEMHPDGVQIYAETGNTKVDVIVGAFGLDDGTSKIFERCIGYGQPRFLDSIVTKIHPGMDYMDKYADFIRAFLPPIKEIEFGAVTPKYNHLTINIAGSKINTDHLDEFLSLQEVRKNLPPPELWDKDKLSYYKGRFPIGIAENFFGDRYVIVGDAAGMMRPFKGKGVNTGIITGMRAAKTMMEFGISKNAFKNYFGMCSDIVGDLLYGRVLRYLTIKMAHMKMIDPLIRIAETNEDVARILFDCVSAHEKYKTIYKYMREKKVISRVIMDFFRGKYFNNK